MIQDIGVEQLKNEYHPKPPKEESRIMIFDAGKLLCRINEEMQIAYPKYGEVEKKIRQMRERSSTFFPLERRLIICIQRKKSRVCLKRCSRLHEHFPERERFAGVSAYHYYTWYENNHFAENADRTLK